MNLVCRLNLLSFKNLFHHLTEKLYVFFKINKFFFNQKNELIIGTINGDILIYKGTLASPWLKNSKPLGSVNQIFFRI